MFKKIILATTLFAGLTSIAHADFFIPSVEASVDRGLVVEIVLTCKSRMSGKSSSSIMSYSKTDKQFCTAKNKCYGTARSAAIESCNTDDTILSKLK